MKNLLYIFILIAMLCCKEKVEPIAAIPKASFVVHNENCKAPCDVQFYNTTRSGFETKYVWEFGDGDSSTTFDARHVYYEGGKYNVRLSAANKVGGTIFEKIINIEKDIPLSLMSLCRVESVKLTKITNNKPDGSRWDESVTKDSLADFVWYVLDKNNQEITRDNGQGDSFNLSQKDLPFTKNRLVRFAAMRALSDYYKLYIIDEDGFSFDIMSEYRFRPVDYFPKQPEGATTITVFTSSFTFEKEGISYEVTLAWQ